MKLILGLRLTAQCQEHPDRIGVFHLSDIDFSSSRKGFNREGVDMGSADSKPEQCPVADKNLNIEERNSKSQVHSRLPRESCQMVNFIFSLAKFSPISFSRVSSLASVG